MKVSEITTEDLANYLRLIDVDENETKFLSDALESAKSFIKSDTGVKDLDEAEDFVMAIFVLVADMYDNRSLYAPTKHKNLAVEEVLSHHRKANIC